MDLIQLLTELTAADGVAGDENGAADLVMCELSKYGKTYKTRLGSVVCELAPAKEGCEHLLLDAHIDEIGFVVTGITDGGFLRVAACGGVDRRLLPAQEVTVHGKKPVYGVICSTPPHLESAESAAKVPKIEDIAIDIGYTKEQAERLVSLGDTVSARQPAALLPGGQITAKALDDRAGVAALLLCAQRLSGETLSCGLTILCSTQEEVGARGAKAAAFEIAPTQGIAVDVSFAYTPDSPRAKCGELGKGPMIGISPTVSRPIFSRLKSLAEAHTIPYQIEVMGGETGTNADMIQGVRAGVPMGLVSIPQRYMHTPVEVVSLEDVENTAQLLCEYAKTLGGGRA